MSPVPSMERSLVRLIGRPGDVPVAKHVLARAEARHLQRMSDPLMCQEQTAIAQTFNEERFQEWEDRLKHERARAKVDEQKQIIVAADIAQAVVFADEAPFLFRLQKVMGRTSRGSSRSRSRGGDNGSTSDGSSDSEAESYSVSSSQAPDPVRKDLQGFCPYLHELPAAFTTFWHQLHGAALLVEQRVQLEETSREGTARGLCLQLALFRQVVSGTAGLPFPQAANSCPTLISSYFEWASELATVQPQDGQGSEYTQCSGLAQDSSKD
ncbi:hypothetical protein AK812_SmicGene31140 [Symbiodinium microadriaticum]|uniref:Uncharacterized protein n=1 Tax=Symbiodinium microadriaticum TaxID=2951 RepID=A0A1Q9CXF3_SYMMI|nr:hypothetical protein AK812_SmicGene31140 [Symbiodinium microadriaticum]